MRIHAKSHSDLIFLHIAVLLFLLKTACKNQISGTEPAQEVNKSPKQQPSPTKDEKKDGTQTDSPSTVQVDEPAEFRLFDFPEPNPNQIKKQIQIWATYYYVPQVAASPQNMDVLMSRTGSNILGSDLITRKDWCALALQGSGQILLSTGKSVVVNYDDRSSKKPLSCSEFIKSPGVSDKIKFNTFKIVNSIYGQGSRVQEMIPFRTIAVDPKVIAYGSLVYFPEARGAQVEFPGGIKIAHDGYFIAGDTGSAIIGNHIDVFVGTVFKRPFDFVKSSPKPTFNAQIIENHTILNSLKSLSNFK